MRRCILALSIAVLAAGCATTETAQNADDRAEVQYVTGSNIPRKGKAAADAGISTYDKEALQRARDAAVQTPRPGLGNSGP